MKKISLLLCLAIVFSLVNLSAPACAYAYTLSRGEMVMERDSGRVLYEYNADAKLPMASTTKVVTALTVIENFDTKKIVTVPLECVGIEGSSVYLQKGDKYTVEDLLYGLMLRSGNDCAETLAVSLSGSIENFVSLMNKTALKYGAKNTNFTNPHGLPSEGHYTTAADLCKIACAAMKNPTLKKIVGTKRHTATELNEGKKTLWVNKNKLLSSFDGATGVKTGYTVRAGRCLVFSAERNGMEVVGVVLDSPQMFERAKELMSDAFRDYSLVKIVDKDRFDYVLPLKNGEGVLPLKIEESFVYPVRSNEKIDAEIRLGDFAENYMSSGEKAGEIKIYCDKKLIFSENISIR